jgi:hypothetical protein
MRRPFLPLVVLVLVVVAACGSTADVPCSCPATGLWPLVAVELPCAAPPLPTMALTGVCAGTGGVQSGQLVFGAKDGGDCHVVLTFADGATYATDVSFSGQWLACGSNPHGCGEQINPVGLPRPSFGGLEGVLVVDVGCADAGGADAGDAASE